MADQFGKLFKGALGLIWTAHETEFDSTGSVTGAVMNRQTANVNHPTEEIVARESRQMNAPINHCPNLSRTLNEERAIEGGENEEQNRSATDTLLNHSTVSGFVELKNNSDSSLASDHQSTSRHSVSRACQTDDLGPSPAKKARTIEISIPEQFDSSKLTKIIDLYPDSPTDWLIIGRVMAKSFLQNHSNQEFGGACFSFEFADKSGQIHVRMSSDSPSDRLTKLYDLLEVDKCYLIKRGTVMRSKRQYGRRWCCFREINLDDHSIVERTKDVETISAFVHSVKDSCIPPIKFNFEDLSSILWSGPVLDLIGVCTEIKETIYFRKKANGPGLRKNVFLIDDKKNQVLLKLFDDYARSFRGQPNDVVVLRDVVVSDFGSVMPTSCTSMEINREMAETERLRKWWSENATKVQLTGKPLIIGWSSLSQISLDKVKRLGCVTIQTKATIVRIGWF